MSSSPVGAVVAASGRGNRTTENEAQDYQIILPQLPSGRFVLNTVFLHADVKARPYRVEDFRDGLARLELLPDVIALGAFQMNHVRAVTFKDAESAKKLVDFRDVKVKDLRCMVIDPNNQVLRVKVHWVLYGVPDDMVRAAFAPYGVVTDVARDRWRVSGCGDKGSTTRLVSLKLKAGVSPDDVPHQLRIAGDNALVVVPGRLPLCLRCQRSGHVRRECRVPRCTRCRRFGHEASQCVQTYATVAGPVGCDDKSEHLMDEAEAEEVAAGGGGDEPAPMHELKDLPTCKSPAVQAGMGQGKDNDRPGLNTDDLSLPPVNQAAQGGAILETDQADGGKESDDDTIDMDTSKELASSTSGKRGRESNADMTESDNAASDGAGAGAVLGRRSTQKPKRSVPPDRREPASTPATTPT
ncbi:uncharacterized protein LOC144161547 [Haemaphysalis longicornis]